MDARQENTAIKQTRESNVLEIKKLGAFDPENEEHLAYIKTQTALFCRFYHDVVMHDLWTFVPVACSVLFYTTGFMPSLAILFLCLASGYYTVRQQQRSYYDELHQVQLDKMVKIYQWCISHKDIGEMQDYQVILDLLKAIYALVPIATLTEKCPRIAYNAFSKEFIEILAKPPHSIPPFFWKGQVEESTRGLSYYLPAIPSIPYLTTPQPEGVAKLEPVQLPQAMPEPPKRLLKLGLDLYAARQRYNYGLRADHDQGLLQQQWGITKSFLKGHANAFFKSATKKVTAEVVDATVSHLVKKSS